MKGVLDMKNELTADDIKRAFTYKQLLSHNSELRSQLNQKKFELSNLKKKQEEIKKMKNNTNHDWNDGLVSLLSQTNKDRNKVLKDGKDKFNNTYLLELNEKYDAIILKAKKQNEEDITTNYFKEEERRSINDLVKYKRNYLLWAYDFSIPSTNNNSEKNIRPVKSKLKISGQFQNINYVKYYATIRSYIETCKKNGINIIDACTKLMNGSPYKLDEILKKDEDNNTL